MTTTFPYHTQGTHGYKYQMILQVGEPERYYLNSRPCPKCRSWNTSFVQTGRTRDIRELFIRFKKVILRVDLRRLKYRDCGASTYELFLPRTVRVLQQASYPFSSGGACEDVD